MEVQTPVPGVVTKVAVVVGQRVGLDDLVCVIEIMKMEQNVKAGVAGSVVAVTVEVGQLVDAGAILAEIAEA